LIEAEFKNDEGVYFQVVEIEKRATFEKLHDDIESAVEVIFEKENMKNYINTHITAVIK